MYDDRDYNQMRQQQSLGGLGGQCLQPKWSSLRWTDEEVREKERIAYSQGWRDGTWKRGSQINASYPALTPPPRRKVTRPREVQYFDKLGTRFFSFDPKGKTFYVRQFGSSHSDGWAPNNGTPAAIFRILADLKDNPTEEVEE